MNSQALCTPSTAAVPSRIVSARSTQTPLSRHPAFDCRPGPAHAIPRPCPVLSTVFSLGGGVHDPSCSESHGTRGGIYPGRPYPLGITQGVHLPRGAGVLRALLAAHSKLRYRLAASRPSPSRGRMPVWALVCESAPEWVGHTPESRRRERDKRRSDLVRTSAY